MNGILGNEFDNFLKSLDQDFQTSIRINPDKYNLWEGRKTTNEFTGKNNFHKGNPKGEPLPYCSTGYLLPKRPLFTIDPFFHSGLYYVQEGSSMFLEQAVLQTISDKPLKVLDLCASPGGKSTHLASLLSRDTLLVSNEVIRQRAQVLSENLKKWGNSNVIVTNNDPRDFARLKGFFDVLVIDAPCSGEGLFRRDERAIAEWSESNATLCSQRQKRILADVWPALKEGGLLIYSTCTFNPEENEENIQWLGELSSIEPVALNLKESWSISVSETNGFPAYRFYPHKVKGEGFFISVVRKMEGESLFTIKPDRKNIQLASKQEEDSARTLIRDEDQEILRFEDTLLAFPGNLINELKAVRQSLRIVHAGVKIGQIIGNKIIPAHELALSTILNREAFPQIDVPIENSLNFFKKEEMQLVSGDRGWNLLSHRDIPIGWVKNLGNRFNSSLPKDWRIRMSLREFDETKLRQEMEIFPL